MIWQAILAFVAIVVANKLYQRHVANQFRKSHGLALAQPVAQGDRILGLGLFKQMVTDSAARHSLERAFELTQERGPTSSFVIFGKNFISTSDPENVKAVLATQFDDFYLGERSLVFGPFLGRGIFTEDGKHWERSRSLIRPCFTKAQIAGLPVIETHLKALVDRIPRNGATVDLQPLFFNFTLDSATDFLFGNAFSFLSDSEQPMATKFSHSFDNAQLYLQKRVRAGALRGLIPGKKDFDQDCKNVHTFLDSYIKDMIEQSKNGGLALKEDEKGAKKYNLLEELLQQTTDPLELRSELLNVLLAARDTTASLLSSTFWLLARHPHVWNKLQDEIAQYDGEIPTYEKLRDAAYVRAVLNEVLRLFPPVPTNIRYAKHHTSLPRGGGPDRSQPIFIEKGTAVAYSVWTMHRSREVYGDDASYFRPERWTDETNPLRPGWGFLPFNGGPRICIGQQKAITEATYVVIRVLQQFSGIEVRDSKPWTENFGLVVNNFNGARIALTPREGAI